MSDLTSSFDADDLDAADSHALDAMPYAVARVDADGRVLRCNRNLLALAGTACEGRDLFRELLPGTNLPAFRGRFLDGVHRGQLAERFAFTFGFGDTPLRAAVSMLSSRETGRFWLVVELLGALQPSRHREAALATGAVERRIQAQPVDPAVCEREPIHIPGAVQPYAVLLVCDPAFPGLPILACSDNVVDALERTPGEVVGRPLASILSDPGLLQDLSVPLKRPLRRSLQIGTVSFAVEAHLHAGRLLIELERVWQLAAATPRDAQDSVALLRATLSLDEAASRTASAVRAITGFERVVVYRFDADWNGSTVAEDKVPGWDSSLLGLRFPASDIPAQARALYARSPARFVVDRDAVPSALQADPAAANEPVDLTFAHARALSPVHLEYQRNLGVNGSMSVSVIVAGKLWGLIIGHHRLPHYVAPDTRALVGLLADAFAFRVSELETAELWHAQQAMLAAQNRLLEQMAQSDDFVAALTAEENGGATLLSLFQASGAVVASDGRIVGVGATPPKQALPALIEWLREDQPENGGRTFATDYLSAAYAPASAWDEVASGLLAVHAGPGEGGRDHLLLWFRPEVVSTVAWGGDPYNRVLTHEPTGTVLPRRSFERWVEERRGHAEPWAPWQVGTAEALAAAIEGVILRQSRRIAVLEAQGAALTRALEQKDVLAREIDHRVKNSLQIVANVMLLQGRAMSDPTAKAAFEDTYGRVMSVARVHDSLQHSDDSRSVDLGQTLRQLCDDLGTGMTGARQRLDVTAEPGLMVSSQTAVALSLVATELVTNALKYAYRPGEAGEVEVSVRGRDAGGVELKVSDSGAGLPPNWSERARNSAGRGGLGMRVIRAMLQQVGAEMTVDSEPPGTCFTVLA